jgi:hypothetical protein
MPSPRACVVLLLVPLVAGCAETARQVAKEATPGGLTGGLEGLSEPQNQERLAALGESKGLRTAAQGLGAGLGSGIVEGALGAFAGEPPTTGAGVASEASPASSASAPSRAARADLSGLPTKASGLVGAVTRELGRGVREDLGPAIEDTVRRSVRGGMDEAFNDEQSRRAAGFASRIAAAAADASVDRVAAGIRERVGPALQEAVAQRVGPALRETITGSLGPALRESIARDVGPALREVIRREIAPALAESLRDELAPSLRQAYDAQLAPVLPAADGKVAQKFAGDTSRLVSREAVLGLHDGLRDIGVLDEKGLRISSLTGQTRGIVSAGLDLMTIAAIGLGLLVLVLALWLGVVLAKSRRDRKRSAEHEAGARELLTLDRVLRAADERPWGRELREMVKDQNPSPSSAAVRSGAETR